MANRSLYIITLLSLLLSVDAWGARCTGLMLKYDIPVSIDVTDKAVGDQLYSFGVPSGPMLYSGQCLRGTNTNGNHIYLVDQYRAASTGRCASGRVSKKSTDGYLRFTADANCGDTAWLLLTDRVTSGNGYAVLKGPGGDTDSGILYLEKKTPLGRTTVNPTFMLTRNFYSRIGENQATLMKESVTFTAPDKIVLINKVSCSVAVNDVSFGTQTVGALKSGTIADKSINIDFSCNGVLPAYTLSFSGQDGLSDATKGIIKVKDNTSIGYQFKWGDNTVTDKDSAVTVNDSQISPATLPKDQNFTVPILVKPVLLSASPIPGNANTALIIKVTLN
ncbi:fimbrial protein [Pragia fontium]|uniref:fimbrial protein n=1 Tax=Pragia fontium TaxID=82985 RepID=UPI00064B7DB3|nr:fimbrial protein [Pragia fontium]AKJ43588.1 fimbrial protein [Pragia fontium]